jgi:hypothetical protein
MPVTARAERRSSYKLLLLVDNYEKTNFSTKRVSLDTMPGSQRRPHPPRVVVSGARLLCSEVSAKFFCSTFSRIAKASSF